MKLHPRHLPIWCIVLIVTSLVTFSACKSYNLGSQKLPFSAHIIRQKIFSTAHNN